MVKEEVARKGRKTGLACNIFAKKNPTDCKYEIPLFIQLEEFSLPLKLSRREFSFSKNEVKGSSSFHYNINEC